MHPNSLEMRVLSLFAFIVIAGLQQVNAQEIVPFPDLAEAYHQSHPEGHQMDDHNYSMYTPDYQKILKDLDQKIAVLGAQISKESKDEILNKLIAEEKDLKDKRKAIILEAELVEDLNKFY